MITAVALSPSLDVAYGAQRAVGIQGPPDARRVTGGKAFNAARAAIRLGADAYAIAVLGGPVGDLVAALAREDGLALEAIAGESLARMLAAGPGCATLDPSATPEALGHSLLRPEDEPLVVQQYLDVAVEVPIPEELGGRGGGDAILLTDVFRRGLRIGEDPLARDAGGRDGLRAVAVGIAANRSLETSQAAAIAELDMGEDL